MLNTIARARTLAVAALLAPALAAQEAPARKPDQVDQVVVETAQQGIAMVLMRGEAPDLKEGEHYRIVLGADGEWTCTAAAGKVALLEVRARPVLLMETFAEEVDQAREMAQMGMAMGAASSPLGAEGMAKIMDAMFAFPTQIDVFTLAIAGDREKGYDAHAELLPVAQGWLAKTVAGLKPSGKGAPALAGDSLAFAFDVHPDALASMVDPLLDFTATMVPEGDRAEMRKMMAESWKVFDGTGAFAQQDKAMSVVYGCTDPQKLQQLFLSDDWPKFQRAMLAQQPDAKFEVSREKVGDLDVLKTSGELDNPMFPDGKFTGYSCVAGDLVVTSVNAGQDALLDLVARATSGAAKRAPLAGGALLTMRMRFADLVALNEDVQIDTSQMPELVEVHLGKKDALTLKIDVRVRM